MLDTGGVCGFCIDVSDDHSICISGGGRSEGRRRGGGFGGGRCGQRGKYRVAAAQHFGTWVCVTVRGDQYLVVGSDDRLYCHRDESKTGQ